MTSPINIQAGVQAFVEEIRLTAYVMLLECVLGALYYLTLRSFSASATAGPSSLLPTEVYEVPELIFRNLDQATSSYLVVSISGVNSDLHLNCYKD